MCGAYASVCLPAAAAAARCERWRRAVVDRGHSACGDTTLLLILTLPGRLCPTLEKQSRSAGNKQISDGNVWNFGNKRL